MLTKKSNIYFSLLFFMISFSHPARSASVWTPDGINYKGSILEVHDGSIVLLLKDQTQQVIPLQGVEIFATRNERRRYHLNRRVKGVRSLWGEWVAHKPALVPRGRFESCIGPSVVGSGLLNLYSQATYWGFGIEGSAGLLGWNAGLVANLYEKMYVDGTGQVIAVSLIKGETHFPSDLVFGGGSDSYYYGATLDARWKDFFVKLGYTLINVQFDSYGMTKENHILLEAGWVFHPWN